MTNSVLAKTKATELNRSDSAASGGVHDTPRTDLYETDDEVVLSCDLPGIMADDIELRFDRGILSLRCQVKPRPLAGHDWGSEYGVGDFYRSFTIPVEVDATKFSAEYRQGVLTVQLPKQERAKSLKILVKAG